MENLQHAALTRTYSRFAHDVREVLKQQNDALDVLTQQEQLQNFCGFIARFDPSRWTGDPRSDLAPKKIQDAFTPTEVIDSLKRLNLFNSITLESLLSAYCARKRQPVPQPDDPQAGEVLAKILSGGLSKVEELLNEVDTSPSVEETLAQERIQGLTGPSVQELFTLLPASLFLTAAKLRGAHFYETSEDTPDHVRTDASHNEIASAIDEGLIASCQRIIANQKNLPTSKDQPERLYAATMNILRTLYNQGSDKGFQYNFMLHFMKRMNTPKPTDEDVAALPFSEGELRSTLARVAPEDREHFLHAVAKQVIDFRAAAEVFEQTTGHAIPLPPSAVALNKLYVAAEQPQGPMVATKLYNLLLRAHMTMAAQHFVQEIATGNIRYSSIHALLMQTHMLPLAHYETATSPELDSRVEWEVLRAGTGESPEEPRKPPQAGQARPIDMDRVDALQAYITMWGGLGYIARTNIPSLAENNQYYVAVLQEVTPEGTLLEHAIADHPRKGHGVYVWRAEKGLYPNGSSITWREVFCHDKRIARQLGARRFNHVDSLEWNVLEYTTRTPLDLARRYYRKVGRSVMSHASAASA